MHWDLSDHPGKVAGTINPYPGHGVAEALPAAAGGSPAPFTIRSHLPGPVPGIVDAISFTPSLGFLLPPSLLPRRAFQASALSSQALQLQQLQGLFVSWVASCGIWPALQQCGAGSFLESTMRTRFTRLRGERGQAAYEPRSLAEWKEEERLLAEAAAQRRQQQATNPTNPPPGGFVVSGEPKCSE